MFIELVDSLRCLEPHEETWLVASVTRMDDRHIVDGVLGCPICRREYPVRDGIGWFTTRDAEPAARPDRARTAVEPDRITRAAALLGLTGPGGIVCLGGEWVDCADGLSDLGPSHIVVLDARTEALSQVVSAIVVDDRLPFSAGTLRAAALDDSERLIAFAAECLRSHGRLVGPSSVGIPDGVVELARDSRHWVGERGVLASPPVPLRSARR